MSFRDEVARRLREVDPPAAERYEQCGAEGRGQFCECSQNPIGSPEEHPSTYHPFSCMLRICPKCAKRLAADLRRKYSLVVEQVLREQGWKVRKGWRFRHVTLTASYELAPDSGAHVVELLDAARDTFKKTWGQADGAGAVASVEVGERGHKWHIHMLVWGPFVSHAELSQVWRRFSGHEVVWLREAGSTVEEARSAAVEVLKYVVKVSSLSPEQLVALHLALKGRRRVRSWGSFYNSGVTLEDDKPRVCEVCGARMRCVPEWLVEARLRWLARGDLSVFSSNTANKSGGRGPPLERGGAPRRLFDGALCSKTPPVTWSRYSERFGGE